MPVVFPDDVEVHVVDQRDGSTLVGVVELVSPRNLDRPEARRAFAAKCSAYLQRGIGLILVDDVTGRSANLHNELVSLLDVDSQFAMEDDVSIYTVSYGPRRREDNNEIELWPTRLEIGAALPTVPFVLRGGMTVPLDLETTYGRATEVMGL